MVFFASSFKVSGVDLIWANIATLFLISAGGLSSIHAGLLAERLGRTRITTISLVTSGACAVLVGYVFGVNPFLLLVVSLVWGFSVVADSAQFSTAISELHQREYTGTAITIQTIPEFLLTIITLQLIPTQESWLRWRWAFVSLALGPIAGI